MVMAMATEYVQGINVNLTAMVLSMMVATHAKVCCSRSLKHLRGLLLDAAVGNAIQRSSSCRGDNATNRLKANGAGHGVVDIFELQIETDFVGGIERGEGGIANMKTEFEEQLQWRLCWRR